MKAKMKIKNKLNYFVAREKPIKQTKYENQDELGKHLTKMEKPKKLYDYYICDYCEEEIQIESKWGNKKGGIVEIPKSLSNLNTTIYLALCNKCINSVLKEFK
jgi:hypothetical protein